VADSLVPLARLQQQGGQMDPERHVIRHRGDGGA
jgi:hypothetical protein